jgi:hypothetical protein
LLATVATLLTLPLFPHASFFNPRSPDFVEPLQIVSYTEGQKFELHHDAGTMTDDGAVEVVPPRRLVRVTTSLSCVLCCVERGLPRLLPVYPCFSATLLLPLCHTLLLPPFSSSPPPLSLSPPTLLPLCQVTLFVYLNNLPAGQGCTHFPALGDLAVTPQRGCGVLFCNVLPSGEADPRTAHRAQVQHIGPYLSSPYLNPDLAPI